MRMFYDLENSMASLLHNVLFWRNPSEETRIALAIYFTPDGFAQRQNIVNNPLREWLIERRTDNPMGEYDWLAAWEDINDRLSTLRKTRNLLAHGPSALCSVSNCIFAWSRRYMPRRRATR